MKVRELIKILEEHDPEAQIVTVDYSDWAGVTTFFYRDSLYITAPHEQANAIALWPQGNPIGDVSFYKLHLGLSVMIYPREEDEP